MPKDEPVPVGDSLRALKGYPSGLMKKARPIYKRVIESMPAELYTEADAQAVVNFANGAAMAQLAIEKIEVEGAVIEGVEGPKENPWSKILRNSQATMMTWGSQLGLSPVARSKMVMPEKPKTSRFDAITGGKRG